MELRWNDNDKKERKGLGKENLSQCHLVHHKSHVDWPGRESVPAPNRLSYTTAPVVCHTQTRQALVLLSSAEHGTKPEIYFRRYRVGQKGREEIWFRTCASSLRLLPDGCLYRPWRPRWSGGESLLPLRCRGHQLIYNVVIWCLFLG
jgi:hypothetical protein